MSQLYIPSFDEILAVSHSMGEDSDNPQGWKGLVGAWPFQEGGGATAFDVSNRGNHGTLTGMDPATDWVGGRHGYTLDFDGTDDYVSVPNGGGLNNRNTGTISLWVKWVGTQDAGYQDNFYGNILGRQSDGEFSNHVTGLTGSDPDAAKVKWCPDTFNCGDLTSQTSPGDGVWRHIAIVFSSGDQTLYMDGVVESTSGNTYIIDDDETVPLSIGAWIDGGEGYMSGQIDDVRIYNRALSPAEIRDIYQDPWAMFRPRRRVTLLVPDSGTSVVPNNTTHAHTAESVALSQVHAITPAESHHNHSAEAPTISQTHAIAIEDTSHGHTAEPPILTQVHSITLEDCLHSHEAETVQITQEGTVQISDTLHNHNAESVGISQTHALTIPGSLHGHEAEEPSILQTHTVTISDALHSHSIESVTLTTGTITPDDCVHAHEAESPTITVTISPVSPVGFSTMSDVRGELYTRISLKKTLEEYIFNDFSVEETYIPYQALEDFDTDHPGGKIYLIGLAYQQDRNLSRTNLTLEEVSVTVGYQKRISDLSDISHLDTLYKFVEQLLDTARKDFDLDGYSWNRNEPLKDDNGVPYSFVGLRDIGLFEAYFTAHYQHARE